MEELVNNFDATALWAVKESLKRQKEEDDAKKALLLQEEDDEAEVLPPPKAKIESVSENGQMRVLFN